MVYEWSANTMNEREKWLKALETGHDQAVRLKKNPNPFRRSFGIYKTQKSFQQAIANEFEDSILNNHKYGSSSPSIEDENIQQVC